MNNEIKKQLSELVKKAIEAAEKTGEFVVDQAPELINEFYKWQTVKNSAIAIIGILLISAMFALSRLGSKDQEYTDDFKFLGRWFNHMSFTTVSGVVLFSTGSILFTYGLLRIIKITIAPKIYLIEYFINY